MSTEHPEPPQTKDVIGEELTDTFYEDNVVPSWEVAPSLTSIDREELEYESWSLESLLEYKDMLVQKTSRDEADDFPFNRRALHMTNPNFDPALTPWISAGIMSFPPGDQAKMHRHPHSGARFVLDGADGMKAHVEGELFEVDDYDMVVTAPGQWHGHFNEADSTATWLSLTDAPFILRGLQLTDLQPYTQEYDIHDRPPGYYRSQFGALRPESVEDQELTPGWLFTWEESHDALVNAAKFEENYDPYDGYCMEYINPAQGKPPVLPTMTTRLQLLKEQETERHEHNSFEFYHVISGHGATTIDGETHEWEEGDFFFVPPKSVHFHEAHDADTILFSVSDRPLLESFGVHMEEAN